MTFRKIVLILVVLLLLLPLFAQEEKSESKNSPNVLIMVVYKDNVQSLLNVTYSRDVDSTTLATKMNELRSVYKGDLEILPNDDQNARGATALVKNCPYKVGEGDALQPFEDVFYDENKITVLFTGQYVPTQNPLFFYEKDGFSVTVLNTKSDQISYEIINNKTIVKLPKDQRTITLKRVGKSMGLWALYIILAIIVLWLIVLMFKRSVRAERARRSQKKQ
ncbi:MAG: hypothetical protein IJS60_02025 [Abditibacteriota bacterium]|nr:hypothetical protein [Abditibacteriota bacterium]